MPESLLLIFEGLYKNFQMVIGYYDFFDQQDNDN